MNINQLQPCLTASLLCADVLALGNDLAAVRNRDPKGAHRAMLRHLAEAKSNLQEKEP